MPLRLVLPARTVLAPANPLAWVMLRAWSAAPPERSHLPPAWNWWPQRIARHPQRWRRAVSRCPALQECSTAAARRRNRLGMLPAASAEQRLLMELKPEWRPRLHCPARLVTVGLLQEQALAAQPAEVPTRLHPPGSRMLQGHWVWQRLSPHAESPRVDRAAREYRCRDREQAVAAADPARTAGCHELPGSATARRLPLARRHLYHRCCLVSPDPELRHRCWLRRWRNQLPKLRLWCWRASLSRWLPEHAGAWSRRRAQPVTLVAERRQPTCKGRRPEDRERSGPA